MLLALPAAAATPSAAVVGGERTVPEKYPWLALGGTCGATLVAPDRLVTAAHCVAGAPLRAMEWEVGGRPVRVIGVAAHPRFRQAEAPPYDVAVVLLDRPVEGARPLAIAPQPRAGREGLVLGTGATTPDGVGDGPLRRATLRAIADRECGTWYRRHGGRKYRRELRPAMMSCAAGGHRAVCWGDSGGPWVVGGRLAGIVSWGKDCTGPSVFVEPSAFREFIADPAPRLKPVSSDAPARIEGTVEVGQTVRCAVPAWKVAPDRVRVEWSSYRFPSGIRRAGRGEAYTVQSREAGRLLSCAATGSNPSGSETTRPSAQVRVAGAR